MTEEELTESTDVEADPKPRSKIADRRAEKKRILAQRIARLMEIRNMTAAELSRAAQLNRDVISTTLLGKTFPNPVNLGAIARALGVEISDLTDEPARIKEARQQFVAKMEVHQAKPGYSLLTINKVVRTSLAARIIAQIDEDESTSRSD